MQSTHTQLSSDALGSSAVVAVKLASLFADQIRFANEEASRDVDALTKSFLSAVCQVDSTPTTAGNRDKQKSDVADQAPSPDVAQILRSAVMEAIARLQFSDRLSQRLMNVCKNLTACAEFLGRNDASISANELTAFLETIRSSFTMEQERKMFDSAFPDPPDTSDLAASDCCNG